MSDTFPISGAISGPISGEDNIDALLPWYATGRLNPIETARVKNALSESAELRRRLALIEDERDETIAVNEALGAPSARLRDSLFRQIDAEPRRVGWGSSLLQRLSTGLSSASSSWLVGSMVAACLVVVVETGTIGVLLRHGPEATYGTASGPVTAPVEGTTALVGFTPDASMAKISAMLDALKLTLVDGPKGGLYRLRLSPEKLSRDDLDKRLEQIRAQKGLIRFVAPAS